jgi:hypothetical protein
VEQLIKNKSVAFETIIFGNQYVIVEYFYYKIYNLSIEGDVRRCLWAYRIVARDHI